MHQYQQQVVLGVFEVLDQLRPAIKIAGGGFDELTQLSHLVEHCRVAVIEERQRMIRIGLCGEKISKMTMSQ